MMGHKCKVPVISTVSVELKLLTMQRMVRYISNLNLAVKQTFAAKLFGLYLGKLNLSGTRNCRLFQTDRICRKQF